MQEQRAVIRAEFGRRLTKLMAVKGWTQSDLARAADALAPKGVTMTRDKVSKYCRGQVLPNQAHLKTLADALEVAMDELLPTRGGTDLTGVTSDTGPRLALEERSDGLAWLRVNQIVPFETAMKVLALLKGQQ